jgi:Minichromosome loss protein, Mcl1, middle region
VEFIQQIAEVESAPTDLHWLSNESTHRLLVACADGTLISYSGTDIIPSRSVLCTTEADNSTVKNDSASPAKAANSKDDAPRNADTFFDDSDDEHVFGDVNMDNGNSKLLPINKKSNPFVDDEADDADGDPSTLSPTTKKSTNLPNRDVEVQSTKTSYQDLDEDMSVDADGANDAYSPIYNTRLMEMDHGRMFPTDVPEKQPPFATSSSPLDLPRRYLCWNSIGSVTLRHNDDDDHLNHRNTVDIHFTDSGVRRPISFTDNLGFILGSLGEDGGVFATDLVEDNDDDDDLFDQVGVPGLSETTRQAVKKSRRNQKDSNKPTGSSIYFHRFETFAALREKDWYITLPNGERALGCATGEGWAAVITR